MDGITDSMDMSLIKFWKIIKDREAHGIPKSRTQLTDRTTITQRKVSAYKSNNSKYKRINLNEFQVHLNWEIFNIKYLVLVFVC